MKYDVEIITFDPVIKAVRRTFHRAAEAATEVMAISSQDCAVVVAAIDQGADYGNFLLWLAGDRAYVRVDEHREHMAFEPEMPVSEENVAFRDEDGSTFEVKYKSTVSRHAGLNALVFWLPEQIRTNRLRWD